MDSTLGPMFYNSDLPQAFERLSLAEAKVWKYWEVIDVAFDDHISREPDSPIYQPAHQLREGFVELKLHLSDTSCRTQSLTFQVGYVLREIVLNFCAIFNQSAVHPHLPETIMRRLCLCMEYLAIYCHHGSVSRQYSDKLPGKYLRKRDVHFSPTKQDRIVNQATAQA